MIIPVTFRAVDSHGVVWVLSADAACCFRSFDQLCEGVRTVGGSGEALGVEAALAC